MEEAPIVRQEKGPVSILTMQYRPYNLLGPTLLGAIADEIAAARDAGSRAIILRSGLRHFSAGADLDIFDRRVAAGSGERSGEGRQLNSVEFLRFMEFRSLGAVWAWPGGSRAMAGCARTGRVRGG